jgi:predicted CoA-binding protein
MAQILEDDESIGAVVRSMRRVAVLGIKTEEQASQPAFTVPQYLQRAGISVVPVPVYFPHATHILGLPVHRTVASIPGDIDVVDVFRRPQDIDAHLDDLIAKRPRAVWFQLGIRNDEAAQRLVAAGIDVIQDRCLMVDHRRFAP